MYRVNTNILDECELTVPFYRTPNVSTHSMRSSLFSYYREKLSNFPPFGNLEISKEGHSMSGNSNTIAHTLSQRCTNNHVTAFSPSEDGEFHSDIDSSDIHTFSILAQAEKNFGKDFIVRPDKKSKPFVDRSAYISSLGPMHGGEPSIELLPNIVTQDLVASKQAKSNRGFEVVFKEDPRSMAIMENCLVRGCGAVVAGGAMGFFFGVMFSSLGTMGNHDPAQRQMQAAIMAENFRVNQANALAAGQPASGAAASLSTHGPPGAPGIASAVSSGNAGFVESAVSSATRAAQGASTAGTSAFTSTLNNVRANTTLAVDAAKTFAKEAAAPAVATVSRAAPAIAPGIAPGPAPVSNPMFLPGAFPGALPSSPVALEDMGIRQAFRQGLADMKVRGIQSAKSFGMVGGLYTVVECTIEKIRGKRDMKNAATSGFVTGAALAARGGPVAIMMGGSGFAFFSILIELATPYFFE